METIATVSLPIFALLFSGYGAKRLALLNGASIVGLNGFVYYFALPALFVVKVAESAVVRRFDWRLVAAYHGAGLCVFAVAMLCGRLFGHRLAVLGLQGLAVAWGNWVYWAAAGPAAFGDGATLPAAIILAFDIILPVSLAIALVEGDLGGKTRWLEIGHTVVGGLARNPLMLAIVAGAVLSIIGLTLPSPVRAFGTLLGGASLVGQRDTPGKSEVAWLLSCWRIRWSFGSWRRTR